MARFGGVKRQPAPMRLNIHRKNAERRLAWLCNDEPTMGVQTGTAALGAVTISSFTSCNNSGRQTLG